MTHHVKEFLDLLRKFKYAIDQSRSLIIKHKIQLEHNDLLILRVALDKLRFKKDGLLGAFKTFSENPTSPGAEQIMVAFSRSQREVDSAISDLMASAGKIEASWQKFRGERTKEDRFRLPMQILNVSNFKKSASVNSGCSRFLDEPSRIATKCCS